MTSENPSPLPNSAAKQEPLNPHSITRPDPVLFKYYLAVSVLTGPLAPMVLLPLWFKYHTLQYRFDEQGLAMSWGILFRQETYLTYQRIQDIHLTRNLVQRWFGIATLSVQTASGSALPEMSIEGILQAEALRDYLYSRMRGSRDDQAGSSDSRQGAESEDELLTLLRDLRGSLERLEARLAVLPPPATTTSTSGPSQEKQR